MGFFNNFAKACSEKILLVMCLLRAKIVTMKYHNYKEWQNQRHEETKSCSIPPVRPLTKLQSYFGWQMPLSIRLVSPWHILNLYPILDIQTFHSAKSHHFQGWNTQKRQHNIWDLTNLSIWIFFWSNLLRKHVEKCF